jgi:selenocysteine lyase/cysteine desulfurase
VVSDDENLLLNRRDFHISQISAVNANLNFLGIKVLRAGAAFLQSIGIARIEQRVRHLTDVCLRALREAGLRTTTPSEWEERAQIINVFVPDPAAVMNTLREQQRIVINVKDDALRVSMSFFNTEEEIERTEERWLALAEEAEAQG